MPKQSQITDDSGRLGPPHEDLRKRFANQSDLDALHKIERSCFPPNDPTRFPAIPGEIERGVNDNQIIVLVSGESEQVVAYCQFERLSDLPEYFVEGVAIDEGWRNRGLALVLLNYLADHARSVHPRPAVFSMTVSPKNTPMIRAALSAGFYGSDYIEDYFGEGQNRIYFRKPLSPYAQLRETLYLPTDASDEVASRIASEYVLSDYYVLPQGPSFCLRKRTHDDAATLSANETASSLSVSAALLGAFTFLFGISVVSQDIPRDLLALLGFGLLCATVSMLVYGKSSGELSRIRSGLFSRQVQVGNAFSEFGGYYVLLFATPAVVAYVSSSTALGLVLCLLASIALGWYHLSGFSMLERYNLPRVVRITLMLLLTILPLLGFLEIQSTDQTWLWSMGVIAFLSFLIVLPSLLGGEVELERTANS